MVFPWLSYYFPMVFPWISYGFPTVFSWFPNGFPMVFLMVPLGSVGDLPPESVGVRSAAPALDPATPPTGSTRAETSPFETKETREL